MINIKRLAMVAAATLMVSSATHATDYHVDCDNGDDANAGTSQGQAWRTLARASSPHPQAYAAGDRLRLTRGCTFAGSLKMHSVAASAASQFIVNRYGSGASPTIDSARYLAGLHLLNSSGVKVNNIRFRSDQGGA